MKKILSLFDGISVAQQALKELGIECEYYASEIDKYAIQITQKNFPETKQLGSVVGLKIDFQPDLLIGGSPCQDLSIAKKNREGLKGSRSSLFYEYVRILKEVKPKYFVLENVNSMPKEAKETITKELFGIEPVMINAALVSAQNRKRLFWVGKLVGDTYEKVEIPQPQDRGILLKDILENNVDESFNVKDSTIKNLARKTYGAKGKILEQETEKTQTLTSSMGEGGGNGIYVKGLCEENGKIPPLNNWSPTLEKNSIIRKLTPIECERLQSLPDNFTSGVSNTQRYKALGNAFNCEVVKHIIKVINI